MLNLNGEYPCILCTKKFNSILGFKKHLFLQHCMSDIKKRYNRSLEQLIGQKYLKQFRAPIMTTIKRDKFVSFSETLLSKSMPFNSVGINRQLPIRHDTDPVSQRKRKSEYT